MFYGNCSKDMSLCLVVSRLMGSMEYKIVRNNKINCVRGSAANIMDMRNVNVKVSHGDFIGFQFNSSRGCSLPNHFNNTDKRS